LAKDPNGKLVAVTGIGPRSSEPSLRWVPLVGIAETPEAFLRAMGDAVEAVAAVTSPKTRASAMADMISGLRMLLLWLTAVFMDVLSS
jgi:hypothetical protein